MSKYLIKLKPLTPFYFGGENKLGEGEVNYSLTSNYLPQQTTLLGMLRYELLAQNALLGSDPISKNWKELIGDKSFENSEAGFTLSFGSILNLSPVFIIENDVPYIVQSMDWAMEEDSADKNKSNLSPLNLSFDNTVDAYTDSFLEKKCPVLKTNNGEYYSPKLNPIPSPLWVSADGSINRPWDYDIDKKEDSINGFFVAKKQVGIHREIVKNKSDKGDFYKQKLFQFYEENTCFAFFVEMNLPEGKKIESRTITMGGERSVFEMTIEDTTDKFVNFFNENTFKKRHPSKTKSIILTSDAFIAIDKLTGFDFMISEAVPFRNITTKQIAQMDYIGLDRKEKGKNKLFKTTELVKLLKRGSILFYSGDLDVDSIFSHTAFENIGYNQIQKIN